MTDPPDREEALFSAARRLPAGQRSAYLDEACFGDDALRHRVEELLLASEDAAARLERPAAVSPSPGGTIRLTGEYAEKSGDRIGRYKLLQQIGEGGCGVVYLAGQEEPVSRRVALKIIKLGMDTRSVIARFEAERQVLALMDHANIAKVLDAGATETGRPYFVMELVRGIKLTDYCDQNNLSTQERLELFMQICQAIQHAHQKGIIHRDIKPSNILVTMNDGVPLPKVIDFGIAKATHGRLTDQTLFTAFEQFIGTPAYMSPEQAEMSALDIDTRSDIYSLGVLLYELLTGQTPFDTKKLLQGGLDEIRRTIREEEPARPSTRLGTMLGADLTAIAKHRKAEPPRLIHLVRGDLDWIVMKCLEKDRTRRYDTVNGLAMDVKRHLENDPVIARPPSAIYRIQKAWRRNKLAFFSTAAVASALVIGLAVSAWQAIRATRAEREERVLRQQAQTQETKAKTEATKSQQVARFLQDMIEGIGPEVAKGEDTKLLHQIVNKTANQMQKELVGQPEVQAELRTIIGKAYYDLGELTNALEMQDVALALTENRYGRESTNTASVLQQIGLTCTDLGDFPRAELSFSQALRVWQATVGTNDARFALTLNDLGLVHWTRGDLAKAEVFISQALAIRQGLLSEHRLELAESFNNLGLILRERGRLAEAEEAQQHALSLKQSGNPQGDESEASYLNNLANVLQDRGDFAGAASNFSAALQIVTQLLPEDHPHVRLVRSHLSTVTRRRGVVSGDVSLFREALQLNPVDPFTADALAGSLADASLTPLGADSRSSSIAWRCSYSAPGPNWQAPDFPDGTWSSTSNLSGATAYFSRSDRAVPALTNLWLRREFELPEVPRGKMVARINRNQDAQVYLNGVLIAPVADWSDANVIVPCSVRGQGALKRGRNVLAFHCQDADGGALIGVGVYMTQDPTLGRKELIEYFDQMIRKEPQRVELYAGRANAFARLGEWHASAADLHKVVEANPSSVAGWCQLAPLLLENGDLADYERLRRDALDRFARPESPIIAGQVGALCLLIPAEGAELDRATKMAELGASAEYADWNLAARQMAQGLAEYRQRRFTSALAWTGKALITSARKDLPGWSHERERNRKVAACLIQAMAYQQLKLSVEARTTLAEGMNTLYTEFPSNESDDMGREWHDCLSARILSREADALVHGTAPSENHPATEKF